MNTEKFDEIMRKLDEKSSRFTENVSATYWPNNHNDVLFSQIEFRDPHTGEHDIFNVSDAVYIFDSFLDIGNGENDRKRVIEFFNAFLAYRGIKIINEGNEGGN